MNGGNQLMKCRGKAAVGLVVAAVLLLSGSVAAWSATIAKDGAGLVARKEWSVICHKGVVREVSAAASITRREHFIAAGGELLVSRHYRNHSDIHSVYAHRRNLSAKGGHSLP
jgi:hypothetical protein